MGHLQKGVTINHSAFVQQSMTHGSQSNGGRNERDNFRASNHVPVREKSGGKVDTLNSSNPNKK